LEQLDSLHADWIVRGNGGIQELRYVKLDFLHKYPFTLKQDTILKKYQFVKQYKILITTREDSCMPGKIVDPNVGIWTRTGQELATALVQVFMNQGITIGGIFLWVSLSTAFQAEVMAVLRRIELLLSKNISAAIAGQQ
jgi:hypothetical protein